MVEARHDARIDAGLCLSTDDFRGTVEMVSEAEAYDELRAYTLAHGASSFIHQHVVDAFAAQHANASTKPITLTFALVGLYLHVEKGYSGRQVRLTHMKLARSKRR